ncbi:MAG: response regulator [Planctomycetes bacterium]|nr:response regulator [Planctomycetota bacterium]
MPLPVILLVEDRLDDRTMFADALAASRLQASLVTAASATEAVHYLSNQRDPAVPGARLPSLIVLDLGLPGISGASFLRIIRAAYSPRDIPIAVLTGSQRNEDQATCESWGISDFLVKPTDRADLVRWIRSLWRFLPASAAEAEGAR